MRIPIRAIAGVQVASGIYCIAAGLFMVATVGWRASILAEAGALSLLAGIWLWRGEARGIGLSMWLQALQVLQVAVPGVAFVTMLEPSLVVSFLSAEGDLFRAAMEPELLFRFGHHTHPLRLELNLLAVVFIVALRRAHAARSAPSVAAASSAPTG